MIPFALQAPPTMQQPLSPQAIQASVDDFRIALAALPGDPDLQENLHQAERYLKAQRNGAKSK